MEVPIIREAVIIFALAIAVLLVCHRLGLPNVVGFLLTGVLCGPHAFGFVHDVEDVQNLAEIGVVLLLFTVGMEFSIKNIIKYKYYFFGGGLLQVVATLLACFFISKGFLGSSWGVSIFFGFLVCLSSTAIVLRVLDEKGETESSHGRLILGILIFQDIVAVPMMLLVPFLAGANEELNVTHFYNFLKGISFLLVMAIIAFRGVPKLLYIVTRTRNRELFLFSVLTICFAVAWITSSIGLSLSLGAFFAGLVISESEYSDEAVANVLPFQEIFTSFFFVSMGMLLDVSFVVKQPFLIIVIALAVLLLKAFLAGGAAIILGLPLRSAILAGIALSQIGEFAFVVAQTGMSYDLMTDYQYQLFLAVSLLTMGLTPSLMSAANIIEQLLNKLPLPQRLKTGMKRPSMDFPADQKDKHLIIVGFGLRGRHLARAAKQTGLSYVILEMNPETVKAEKKNGEPIYFGDPSHHAVLQHAGVKTAHTVAVVINDPTAAKRIIKAVRDLNSHVYIISRTRYFREVQRMFQIGANDVIPDEFGSSLEIFTRVLQKCGVAPPLVNKCVNELRLEGYETLRWQSNEIMHTMPLEFDPSEARIETLNLKEGSSLIGKTIETSGLKKDLGLTVLLIKREGKTMTSIQADTVLNASDALVVLGTPDNLVHAQNLLQPT